MRKKLLGFLIFIIVLIAAGFLFFQNSLPGRLSQWGISLDTSSFQKLNFSKEKTNASTIERLEARSETTILEITKIIINDHTKYIEDKKFLLTSLFLPTTSPYPEVITNIIECPDEFKPKVRNTDNGIIYTLFANERLSFGVCNQDLVKYNSEYGIFDCKVKGIFEIKTFWEKEKKTNSVLNSFSCGDAVNIDLRELVKQEGIVSALNRIKGKKGCHFDAHAIGHISYEEYGDKIFRISANELLSCKYGWYHGAAEAFFKKNGTKNLADSLQIVCPDPNFRTPCFHGAGHGLMAFSKFNLTETLKYCDLILNSSDRIHCLRGAFMENSVGLLHDSSDQRNLFLSDDPQFPCTIVEEKYKETCYQYQPYRMIALSKTGLEAAENSCNKASLEYQKTCLGMLNSLKDSPGALVAACDTLVSSDLERACILGIVQSFNKPSKAIEFCSAVDDNYIEDCCKIAKC